MAIAQPRQLGALLGQLQHRHQARPLDELVEEGLVLCADLELDPALQLVLPQATPEQRRLLLEPSVSEHGARLQLLFDLLLQLTLRDPLTGLYNRRHFEQRLEQELRRALREETSCSLLLLDVDNFKEINDLQGHDVGDRALCQLAEAMTETLRVSDEIARLGGDEFAALLPSTTPRQVTDHVDRRLRATLAKATPQVSVSIGVAGFFGYGDEPISGQELYRRADEALYAAKHAGKNSIAAFGEDARATAAVTADERKALLR